MSTSSLLPHLLCPPHHSSLITCVHLITPPSSPVSTSLLPHHLCPPHHFSLITCVHLITPPSSPLSTSSLLPHHLCPPHHSSLITSVHLPHHLCPPHHSSLLSLSPHDLITPLIFTRLRVSRQPRCSWWSWETRWSLLMHTSCHDDMH